MNGRPKSDKRHPLDTLEMWQHIRSRGIALYHHKPSKMFDDLRKESNFVRLMVKRVKANNTKNLSKELTKAIERLIVMLDRNEAMLEVI